MDYMADLLSAVRQVDPFADYLATSPISNIPENEYLNSEILGLNYILSGSLFKGLPPRILGLNGLSKSGKTYVTMKLMARAQKKGYRCLVLDTEGAITRKSVLAHGIDPDKVIFIPVGTVNQVAKIMKAVADDVMSKAYDIIDKGPEKGKAVRNDDFNKYKTFIALDSLGNLGCTSDSAAIQNDSATMGSRAKLIREMFRDITDQFVKLSIPMVFTNHVYSNPGQMHPSKVRQAAGGGGPEYLATTLIQFDSSNLYTGSGSNKKHIGNKIRAFCTKNREVPPLEEIILELTPQGGFRKYSGMIDLAIEAGVMKMSNSHVLCPDGKKRFREAIMSDDKVGDQVFTKEVLEKIDAYTRKKLRYSSIEDMEKANPEDDSEEFDA